MSATGRPDDVVLRVREGVTELIVNGVFAMDSAEVSSELALADACLPARRVLVGGLGLGYTAVRLLEAGVAHVRVVELSAVLVAAARDGATEQLARLAADPRVELVVGDIADAVTPGWDAIALDVDNGPSFLIHDHNAALYGESFLSRCLAALNPSGKLLIWCESANLALEGELRRLARDVEVIIVPVFRGERSFDYAIYVASNPA
jgi:spermidine synthase